MKRRRSLLAVAIEREDWDAAAVVLLLGVVEAAHRIPPETLEEMIALLSEKYPGRSRGFPASEGGRGIADASNHPNTRRSRKPRRAHR